MRVLFDQCTPEALRKELPGHDIQTANEAGVSDLENGDLIRAGLEWLADAKLIPKNDVPQRERDLLEDFKRRRSRGQGR